MALQKNKKIILKDDKVPMLTCANCGKIFPSRGKKDEYALEENSLVYCDECENKVIKELIGGPLDGKKTDT